MPLSPFLKAILAFAETVSVFPTSYFRLSLKTAFSGSRMRRNPRGSIYTTIMELGSKSHNKDGLLGPNSIMVVYMNPLG